ncbi:lysozyme inhibitor LprI family protein [Halomonas sp. BM-2019]|uniref:lysozyme inhibitor LprI family protein n=1 Tax=Halomonas sp. BM-2019 TaxID=2811227 RepID=UPI001B3C30E3|nr:MAG: DUF1311 domain-containing protein [Halomonas sp. BM-2019]
MPMLRRLACLLLVSLPSTMALGQSLAFSPSAGAQTIAYELEACMAEGEWLPEPSLACARRAEASWEEEVDRLAARLDKVLGREARQALEVAMTAWREGREADLALVESYHDQLEAAELGDPELLHLSRQLHRNGVLEQRARYLQRLLEGLETLQPDRHQEAP